jgi:hypothetical protein
VTLVVVCKRQRLMRGRRGLAASARAATAPDSRQSRVHPLGRRPALAAELAASGILVGVSYEGYGELHDRVRPMLGGGASSQWAKRGICPARDAGVLDRVYTAARPAACI